MSSSTENLDERKNPYQPTYTFPEEFNDDVELMEDHIRRTAAHNNGYDHRKIESVGAGAKAIFLRFLMQRKSLLHLCELLLFHKSEWTNMIQYRNADVYRVLSETTEYRQEEWMAILRKSYDSKNLVLLQLRRNGLNR